MLTTHPFTTHTIQVLLQNNPHTAPCAAVMQQVDAIWQQEKHRRQTENCQVLFNGELFCVDEYVGNTLVGHRSEYRFWVAQFLQPHLFAHLHMRPLAVSGLLLCREGLVFGQRGLSNTTGAGLWELIPSGGVDTQHYQIGQNIEMTLQIQLEFQEETGCHPQVIECIQPLCLIENHQSHSIDIGLLLSAPQLTFDDLQANHATTTFEYTKLQAVSINDLPDYLEQSNDHLVSVSTALAQYWMRQTALNPPC